MKKNILLVVVIAVVGTAIFTLNNLRAQNAPVPGAPSAGQPPPQGVRPMPPGLRTRQGARYRQAVMFLNTIKQDLLRSKDDFDGHRQSAIDACDKAVKELEAVQASIQAAAEKAAAAAAAQQAPAQTPAPAPAQ